MDPGFRYAQIRGIEMMLKAFIFRSVTGIVCLIQAQGAERLNVSCLLSTVDEGCLP